MRAIIGRAVVSLASIAAATSLPGGASAYALSSPPIAAAMSAGGECARSEAPSDRACFLNAKAGMGGGHASSSRGRHTASTPGPTTGFGAGRAINDRLIDNRIDNGIRASDGNVTNGPNVAVRRDINDRRAVLLNDGRVVVLNDRRAAVLNGMSGVLIRFRGDGNVASRDINDRRSVRSGGSGVIIRFHGD